MRAEIDESKVFPNGTFIFRADGSQIDPKSDEGLAIQGILTEQAQRQIENRLQKLRWIMTTFPRDRDMQDHYKALFGLN